MLVFIVHDRTCQHLLASCMAAAQDFFPTQVFVAGIECRLRINLDLNVPIPSVLPNGTLIESTEQPISVTLGQVRLLGPPLPQL